MGGLISSLVTTCFMVFTLWVVVILDIEILCYPASWPRISNATVGSAHKGVLISFLQSW